MRATLGNTFLRLLTLIYFNFLFMVHISTNDPVFQYQFHLIGLGIAFGISLISLLTVFITRLGKMTRLVSMLELMNSACCMGFIIMAGVSFLTHENNCVLGLVGAILYVTAEICVDSYLLCLVYVTVDRGRNQKSMRVLWIGTFILMNPAVRIISLLAASFSSKGFCNVIANPVAATIANASFSLFDIVLGITLCFRLFDSREHVLANMGIKSALFSILLVVVKISLYVPYLFRVIGPHSVVFIYLQCSLESLLFQISVHWATRTQKVLFSTSKSLPSASP
jgi:hypothetical protein